MQRILPLVVTLFILVTAASTNASTPPSWVPQIFPCPGRVVGVVDYTSKSAYIFPLQKVVKVAVPKARGAWRTGCAKVTGIKKDQTWCPTPNMKRRKPEAKCAGPYSRDKSNPTGVAMITVDFIDDPTDRYLAFHGTDTEKALGHMITSGCVRTDNTTILALVDGRLVSIGDFFFYRL